MTELTESTDIWAQRTSLYMNAHHCDARDILSLLHVCLDRPFTPVKACTFQTLGPIAQVCRQTEQSNDLSSYLLLLDPRECFMRKPVVLSDTNNPTPSRHAVQLEDRTVDFCLNELERTKSRWKDMSQQNPSGINSKMWRVMSNFCIVTAALSALFERSGRPVAALDAATALLRE